MNETFQGRLQASVKAGWWTLLIGAGINAFQTIAGLVLLSSRPSWLPALWGNGVDWDTIQNLLLWGTAVFKLCLWILALIVIWLTLWSRQLKKQAGMLL
jgi:ascorbate-specific PTS system EIIC-type component UlaA